MTTSSPVVDRQAPGHEVGQQGGHDGLVLGVAEPQPDRDLGAVGGDDQGRHAALAGHFDAVDHHDGHVQGRQVAGHELGQGGLGGLLPAPRDRRPPGAFCLVVYLSGERLGHIGVAAGGHPGQHPLGRELVEQVLGAEDGPAVQRYFLAVDASGPGAARRSAGGPQHDRPGGGAVPVSRPLRQPGVLGADAAGELVFHDLVHDHEAHVGTEAEQAVLHGGRQVGQGDRRL